SEARSPRRASQAWMSARVSATDYPRSPRARCGNLGRTAAGTRHRMPGNAGPTPGRRLPHGRVAGLVTVVVPVAGEFGSAGAGGTAGVVTKRGDEQRPGQISRSAALIPPIQAGGGVP